jgi:hypothetical protein
VGTRAVSSAAGTCPDAATVGCDLHITAGGQLGQLGVRQIELIKVSAQLSPAKRPVRPSINRIGTVLKGGPLTVP